MKNSAKIIISFQNEPLSVKLKYFGNNTLFFILMLED